MARRVRCLGSCLYVMSSWQQPRLRDCFFGSRGFRWACSTAYSNIPCVPCCACYFVGISVGHETAFCGVPGLHENAQQPTSMCLVCYVLDFVYTGVVSSSGRTWWELSAS